MWHDDGFHRVNDNGVMELESVNTDNLSQMEPAEVIGSGIYVWDFREHGGSDAKGTPINDASATLGHLRTGETGRTRNKPT